MTGVFQVARSIFDHDIFAREPFTEREAWIWLIGSAVWKAKTVRVGRHRFNLQRGQCAFSIRFLAEKWQWTSARVFRFLNRLKTETMVTTVATHGATQITICKYDEYQYGRNTEETIIETPTETLAEHSRNKEEELKKDKKEEEESIVSETSSDLPKRKRFSYPEEFEKEFWTPYPTDPLMAKKAAFEAWKRLSPEDRKRSSAAIPAFRRYCEQNPDYRPVHACRFITQRRYEGFTSNTGVGPPEGLTDEERAKWVRAQMDAENAKNKDRDNVVGNVLERGQGFRPAQQFGSEKSELVRN